MEMGERAQVDIMTTGYGKIKVRNEDPNIISVPAELSLTAALRFMSMQRALELQW